MEKKLLGWILIVVVLCFSLVIMLLPTVFTKGLSRIELKEPFDLPLVLQGEREVELVFFGYSGCSDICTPRLASIADFYEELDAEKQKQLGVLFVDISAPSDRELPQRFAEFFNKEFQGIYLEKKVIRAYTKPFNVFFSPSLMEESEYEHTTNLYLVKRGHNKKEIRYVYTAYPYDFKQITSDLEELINE